MKIFFRTMLATTMIGGAVLFSSCQKDNNDEARTRYKLIQGTWNLTAYGQDDNMNGRLEESEKDLIPSGALMRQTYNADGSGKIETAGPGGADPASNNITWELRNNEAYLAVTQALLTSVANISTLTETEFSGYDTAASTRIIYLFNK